jgi:hypothetical protein
MEYPQLEHFGATAWIAQASLHGGNLYHAVLIGHQTALKAINAGIRMGHFVPFPNTGQTSRRYGENGARRIGEVQYHGRVTGEPERGLYLLGLWADNADLLEKRRCFHLIDPEAQPVPIEERTHTSAYARRKDPLPLPSREVLGRFLAWLNEALLTPLLPEWAPRLWQEGSAAPTWSPLVQPMLTIGCAGWTVKAQENPWQEIVQEMLREEDH